MKPHHFALLILASTWCACERSSFSEVEAFNYLDERGIEVSHIEGGFFVSLSPETDPVRILKRDVVALNSLEGIHEIRVISSNGIAPEVMNSFEEMPVLKTFAVHYRMPDRSLNFLDRFPNLEAVELWGPNISLHHLPVLQSLRHLDYDSPNETPISNLEFERILTQPRLKRLYLARPLTQSQYDRLSLHPTIEELDVHTVEPD
ncbi:MAG: hypothetical protein AAF357_01315 [Verrucomicrobiota bacterium]